MFSCVTCCLYRFINNYNVLMCNLLSLPIYQQLSLFMLLISLFIKVYVLVYMIGLNIQGRIQDFKLGGAHLKKLRRAGGGAKFVWVFRVKNLDFTSKNQFFFQLRREARKFLGYFVWKITILRQKILFFPILGGGRAPAPPPWIRPWYLRLYYIHHRKYK
jgi:hypothetical protein